MVCFVYERKTMRDAAGFVIQVVADLVNVFLRLATAGA